MRALLLLFIAFIFLTQIAHGQISRGGIPGEIIQLKKGALDLEEMPFVDNSQLRERARLEMLESNELKPLKFAHAFTVDLSPKNSGEWFRLSNGDYCWSLTIRSKGAKSINLIFENFELPPNTKLYLFNTTENHVLGAFTSHNNKASGKFAVAPVKGDRITIQYEVPEKYLNESHFEIKSVNHDFIGILDRSERRPLGVTAGSCNVDINCELGEPWDEVKNAVCRMIVKGKEICTGSLINNTAEDQKPYVISAAHCYDKWEYAETTVYAFNYESPFCAPLDGDPVHSISGAIMKAQFDSMDFALTELSVIPPPEFRPYYVGWDRTSNLPDSTVSIHHPQGDIKKIALDTDPPTISDFGKAYIKNGFLKIDRWEEGVTEVGSSGGPLFDMNQNLIGTLTGGVATCSNPVRDYFERFEMAWDYRSDTTKQLKYWLDPLDLDEAVLAGRQFNVEEDYCKAYTNLNDEDSYALVSLTSSDKFAGYWGGTNSVGISEFVEKFTIEGEPQLAGISLGVGMIDLENQTGNSEIGINVYKGSTLPESLIYSRNVLIRDLVKDAMNFIGFGDVVIPGETFFVGFELSNVQPADSFVLYQSLRPANTDNYFCFKQNNTWYDFEEENLGYNSMANVIELVVCNAEQLPSDTPIVDQPTEIAVFPNPSREEFILESPEPVDADDVSVLNLIGQQVETKRSVTGTYQLKINLTGNVPGVYFIRLKTTDGYVSKKVSFVPW